MGCEAVIASEHYLDITTGQIALQVIGAGELRIALFAVDGLIGGIEVRHLVVF